jgi:hypothetical protein
MSRWDGCDTCTAWHNPLPFEEDMGENSEPIAFSKSHCHMNESEHCHLAGERYIIHVGQDNEHMNVCPDCYLKHHGVYEEQNDD